MAGIEQSVRWQNKKSKITFKVAHSVNLTRRGDPPQLSPLPSLTSALSENLAQVSRSESSAETFSEF